MMGGSFSATHLGMVLINVTLISTAVCGIACVWAGARLTRRGAGTSLVIIALAALFPAAVAAGMCALAETEHLGLDVFSLMFGVPAILFLVHTLPLLVLFWRSRKHADIRPGRARLALAACVANLASVGVSCWLGGM